ncbi:DUF6951 family protein [Methanolobus psychrotolerans]|uniref:DUF6951 family protein n=1 Tax=Methanolobus psychrotolerans TaxID=1874706 RepID=UPI000B91A178|nr:hypothetical protein [Methanolobus psychrotolerans]
MTVIISLENICRNKTTILAQHEGKNTRINVDTTCAKIKKWGNEFNLPKMDLMDRDVAFDLLNKKMEMYSICSNCYVPPTVMSAYWIENGKISKDIVKKYKSVNITFEEIK